MTYHSFLIKPASSLCNLRCKYCFYEDVSTHRACKSYGLMSDVQSQLVISNIVSVLKDGDAVTFAFQGGEPTLASIDYFSNFVSFVHDTCKGQNKKLEIHYALQTNGILLDEKWCSFLHDHHFLVGLSLDCSENLHNQNRVDADSNGTYETVMKAFYLLKQYRVEFNILSVLTNQLARHPQTVWNFLLNHKISYVQFIPCLSDLYSDLSPDFCLTPKRFSEFYTGLLSLWKKELMSGNYISIKFFDDLFHLLLHHEVTACGFSGHCSAQYVIESDGSVYPCDFYVLDQWKLGNLCEETLTQVSKNPVIHSFITRRKTLPALCSKCKWKPLCNGGCPRMEANSCVDKSGTYCGYKDFLEKNTASINEILAFLSAQNGHLESGR